MFRTSSVPVRILIILFALLNGCGPDVKTLVTFDRSKVPTLGRVGIVCVYEPHGPMPGILDMAAGKGQLGIELFRQASPAKGLRETFAHRIAHVTGVLTEIDETDPEVARIKGTKGSLKIDYYQVEKFNYQAIGEKYGIQTLIILRTWDYTYVTNLAGASSSISLLADGRMVDIHTGKILWRKEIGSRGCGTYIGPGFPFDVGVVKRHLQACAECVIDQLCRDFERSP